MSTRDYNCRCKVAGKGNPNCYCKIATPNAKPVELGPPPKTPYTLRKVNITEQLEQEAIEEVKVLALAKEKEVQMMQDWQAHLKYVQEFHDGLDEMIEMIKESYDTLDNSASENLENFQKMIDKKIQDAIRLSKTVLDIKTWNTSVRNIYFKLEQVDRNKDPEMYEKSVSDVINLRNCPESPVAALSKQLVSVGCDF